MIPIYLDLLEGLQNIFTIGATNGGFPIGKIRHHLKKTQVYHTFLGYQSCGGKSNPDVA